MFKVILAVLVSLALVQPVMAKKYRHYGARVNVYGANVKVHEHHKRHRNLNRDFQLQGTDY